MREYQGLQELLDDKNATIKTERQARQTAEALAESAENDCQRAIAAKQKADHDLRCLQESTVDSNAFDQMKAAKERAEAKLAEIKKWAKLAQENPAGGRMVFAAPIIELIEADE